METTVLMTEITNKPGYVYILTNPSMPDWIKIGSAKDVNERLKDLNKKTAVPLSFSCYAKVKVDNCLEFEKSIHNIIDSVNPDLRAKERVANGDVRVREFFRMSPAHALRIFRTTMNIFNIPKSELFFLDATEDEIQEESQRRKNTTFEMLGIPSGTELSFIRNEDDVKVITFGTKNKVIYNNEEWNISALAGHLLKRPSGTANGFEWFTFNGKSLWDIRIEKERITNIED